MNLGQFPPYPSPNFPPKIIISTPTLCLLKKISTYNHGWAIKFGAGWDRKCVYPPPISLWSQRGSAGISLDRQLSRLWPDKPGWVSTSMSLKVWLSPAVPDMRGTTASWWPDTSDPALTLSLTQICCFTELLSAKFILPILSFSCSWKLFTRQLLPQLSLVALKWWQQTWKYFNEHWAAKFRKFKLLNWYLTNQILVNSTSIN